MQDIAITAGQARSATTVTASKPGAVAIDRPCCPSYSIPTVKQLSVILTHCRELTRPCATARAAAAQTEFSGQTSIGNATMITEAGPLNLKMGPTGMTCKVHPTVLVTICDSFVRRPQGAVRVIGTLLGNEAPDNSIVVKACYAVPHEETEDQVRCSLRQCTCAVARKQVGHL